VNPARTAIRFDVVHPHLRLRVLHALRFLNRSGFDGFTKKPTQGASMAERITLPIECICCDTSTTVTGNKTALDAWKETTRKSDDVFRRLAPELRTFVTTLICPSCYTTA
jgi:hypothetical protein